jgi:hypothetical protein
MMMLTSYKHHPCCFGLVLWLPSLKGVIFDQSALDGYSMVHFFYQNAVKKGMSRRIFAPAAPLITHPSQVFPWRTSLALLLPHPCQDPSNHQSLLENVLTLLRSLEYSEVHHWLDLYLIIGIDRSCSQNSAAIAASLSGNELVLVELVEFPPQILLITEKFDYLSLVAHSFGCNFFLTLQPNTVLSERHTLWRGISTLIEGEMLPDFEGFGFVLFPATRESLLSCSPIDVEVECRSPVALFGRSHVELFVLPAMHENPPPAHSWTSLAQKDFNLLACMLFYCQIYHGVRDSCTTIFDSIATAPGPAPFPLPEISSNPEARSSLINEIPNLIIRRRIDTASWLSTASPYGFRFSLQSLVSLREPVATPDPTARIVFITAIYGAYESSLKPFARQSIASDFICFTDLPESTPSNGWIVDRTPYHETIQLPYDSPDSVNSLSHNRHPMNVGKFYKAAFHFIPRLQHYDLVVWIDGNVVVTNSSVSTGLLRIAASGEPLTVFEHTRNGLLVDEVDASSVYDKYQSTSFGGFVQPRQDVLAQYDAYLRQGYQQEVWRKLRPSRPQYGLWVTCFVGFDMRDDRVREFLTLWHEHLLRYTTQDQISFSFVTQSLGLLPHSLPDEEVEGTAHLANTWFYKTGHAK